MSYHFKTDQDYKEYVKGFSIKDLNQVLINLDREKYPKRALSIENEISRKKASPEYKTRLAETKILLMYKTFWRRLLAHAVDGILLLPIEYVNRWIERSASDDFFLFTIACNKCTRSKTGSTLISLI